MNFFSIFSKENEKGGILLEFAIMLPLFLLLTFPVVDLSRYILLQQKLVKAAAFMADAVAMSRPILSTTTQADIDTDGMYITLPLIQSVVNSMNTLMSPFPPEQQGGTDRYQAVITQVYATNTGAPVIGWQYDLNSQSFYDTNRTSAIGVIQTEADINSPATLPAPLVTLFNTTTNFSLVAAEVSALYEPVTPNLAALGIPFFTPQRLEYTSYYYARHRDAYATPTGLKCIWGVYMPPPDCPPI